MAINTSANINFTNAQAGTYLYRLAVGEAANFGSVNCRVLSPVLTVTVRPVPIATAGANKTLCVDETLSLSAEGGNTYSWTGPAGFTSTQQNPVITNMQNINAGVYTVTVKSAAGCTAMAQTTVAIGTRPTVVLSPATTICQGEATNLTASGGLSYSWLPQAGLSDSKIANPVASPAQTTTYTVTVTDLTSACPATDTVVVTVLPKVIAKAGRDKEMLAGNAVKLDGSVTGSDYRVSWSPTDYMDDATKLNPTVSPIKTTIYTLTVVSNNGCNISTDNVTVTVFDKLKLPNAFTPNGDGINDTWELTGLTTYPGATVQVFNRYGNQVFYSNGYSYPWDGSHNGKALPVGTYYYIINPKNGFAQLKGSLTILR